MNRWSLSFLIVAALALPSVSDDSHGVSHADLPDHEQMDAMDVEHLVVDRAAGEHHDGDHHDADHAATPPLLQFDLGSAICNLLIFLGVFGILAKFVWPPILDGLRAREEKIHGDLIRAEKANEDAKTMLAEYQSKLDEAQTEVQAMLASSRKDAEASAARIAEQAKADADRQRERAVADIEAAKKIALADLADQTSSMAIGVASKVVGRELRPEDHAELIRHSLDRMPSQN